MLKDLPKNNADQEPTKPQKAATAESSKLVLQTTSPSQFTEQDHVDFLLVDPNNGRRKRRKTASPKGTKGSMDLEKDNGKAEENLESPPTPASRKNVLHTSAQNQNRLEAPLAVPMAMEMDNSSDYQRKEFPQAHGPSTANSVANKSSTKINAWLVEPSRDSENTSSTGISGSVNQNVPTTDVETKPRKVLRLNPKTGTIGSPPAKRSVPAIEPVKKRASRGELHKSKVVTLRYGPHEHLASNVGIKIDQILNNIKKDVTLQEKNPPASTDLVQQDSTKESKALHPLFSARATAKISRTEKLAEQETVRTTQPNGVTVSERAKRGSPNCKSAPTNSQVTAFAGFGTSTKVFKLPGAVDPAWPWQGMVHVRGTEVVTDTFQKLPEGSTGFRPRAKKSKYHAVQILATESIIETLAADLRVAQVAKSIQEINPDEFPSLPLCLRIPTKHYESGFDIQRRVRTQVQARLLSLGPLDADSSQDEIQIGNPASSRVHPALLKIYNSIATSLSAFDQGQCEGQLWIQKYSPKSAAEVLQTGREAMILREWLLTLTVKSVEGGLGETHNSRDSSVSKRSAISKPDATGKRRRKAKKLDGFVVSSDEEENEMDEITEPEEDSSPYGSQGPLKRTVIRAGDLATKGSKDPAKMSNSVVISGPHGCGKTATVYAVAKELGFEVFEINSSSRRSGKDILEKVGDMTRNHLVQRSHLAPLDPVDEDNQRINDALANDLKSGRQGTMKSFFKPKMTTKPRPRKTKSKVPEETKTSPASETSAKVHKQSLILIEEVDILYKQDNSFWPTIISLISTSKRPIILTCSDESAVPFQDLTLHAIIRLAAPPVNLAVDYMLLVAACEGHVLRREAVNALYESRNMDFRASLTELNFWCQFAVGDVKGGLDWYYPRWPRGSDVDKYGNTIRVVSEDTYEYGMGWLCQDFITSHSHPDIEEEIMHEAWNGWQLDVGDWHKNTNISQWAKKMQDASANKKQALAALSIYSEFAEDMSSADMCSGRVFAADNQVWIKPSSPLQCLLARSHLISHFQNYQQRLGKTIPWPTISLTLPYPSHSMASPGISRCG